MTYRPDIDGLRAVAVILVVLFHLGVPFFSGGFVGVDVFFVISGYLITGGIHEQCERGEFSLPAFYERRVRRILPALLVMLVVCWGAAATLFMPADFIAFSRALSAASLSVSNIFFWNEHGYFAGPSELKPLLHTWSLAIEEQFYAAFPLLILLLRRWAPSRVRTSIVVMVVLSLLGCIWCTRVARTTAFFWLPFRAWELLTGSVLALRFQRNGAPRWVREPAAAAGLGFILVAGVLYTERTTFPGVRAAVPVAGTALVIIAGRMGASIVNRLLAWRPLVTIGLMSYSVYLWHWPMIAFTRYVMITEPTALHCLMLGVASFALGGASWRWIEQPFRRRKTRWVTHRVLVVATSIIFALTALGVTGTTAAGFPGRWPDKALYFAAMLDHRPYVTLSDGQRCFLTEEQTAAEYPISQCAAFSPEHDGVLRVLVYGDSYAAHLVPGLRSFGDIEVKQFTASGCRPMSHTRRRCDEIYQRFFSEVVNTSDADVVVVASHWSRSLSDGADSSMRRQLRLTLAGIVEHGKRVVLVGESPTFYRPVPYILATHPDLRGREELILPAHDARQLNRALSSLAQDLSIEFYDPYDHGCVGSQCVAASNDIPYHYDEGHMTLAGSTFYARGLLISILGHAPQ